ncbi:hypothetical protein RCC89_15455 [Cytophagaceae bacterium ABcell3]|nr:hypothetical protein RCC89_15455 [Cytophagaceae bacterium ABcell3]
MSAVKKIQYRCIRKPSYEGFEEKKVYKGRTFNNLFEISSEWASHKPTYLIEKKVFDQFFELMETDELVVK